jgi:hypothetical protein
MNKNTTNVRIKHQPYVLPTSGAHVLALEQRQQWPCTRAVVRELEQRAVECEREQLGRPREIRRHRNFNIGRRRPEGLNHEIHKRAQLIQGRKRIHPSVRGTISDQESAAK